MYVYEEREEVAKLLRTKKIEVSGIINAVAELKNVTTDIEEAIKDATYICIVTPAFAHQYYVDLLKGKVKKEQIVITYPGAFAALQFKHTFGDAECPIFADANNLPYDARLTGLAKV